MRSPMPSLPVAGTDSPPVASTTAIALESLPRCLDRKSARRARHVGDRGRRTAASTPFVARERHQRVAHVAGAIGSRETACRIPLRAPAECRGRLRRRRAVRAAATSAASPRSRCVGESVTKRSGAATDGSTLQRPPPLMRILRPPSLVRSISVTFAPAAAANAAATRPAAPAPTTTTDLSAGARSAKVDRSDLIYPGPQKAQNTRTSNRTD